MVALPPQFVAPQDGHAKQDCELAASARWLEKWGEHYGAWGVTYLGDDLYCHQIHCERVLAQHSSFIFTCLPTTHSTLYEWVEDFDRADGVSTLVTIRWDGKKRLTDTYRYVNQVPLRDSADALLGVSDGKILMVVEAAFIQSVAVSKAHGRPIQSNPIRWDNDYLSILFKYEWELTKSPAGAQQWRPKDASAAGTVPDAHDASIRHAYGLYAPLRA